MTSPVSIIPVCAIGGLTADMNRISIDVPTGYTIAQIIEQVLPNAPDELLARARVWLVDGADQMLIASREAWGRIRPKAGASVMIRLVPGNSDMLRNALMIAVAVGATALGQLWAAPTLTSALTGTLGSTIAGVVGNIGGALVTTGALLAGSYLINLALPQQSSNANEKPAYMASGWRNPIDPGAYLSSLCGRRRMAPTFLHPPLIEIVGDEQYLRGVLTYGYGPVRQNDLRLGDTPIGNFDGVEYEYREGWAGDAPLSLVTQQVIQDALGVELRRDRLKDDAGNIGEPGPVTPASRFTATDATEACVIFQMPAGLGTLDNEGQIVNYSLNIRIRQRLNGTGSWQNVTNFDITAAKAEAFYRSYRWPLPERGRWEVECAVMTSEPVKRSANRTLVWLMLQSFRPEYPLNFDMPVSLLAIRIKSSKQLAGQLDTINALAERLVPDYDVATGTWITRATSNPASYMRLALQGRENLFPDDNAGIDFAQLEDFHNFCRIKGLKYDRLHDFEASFWSVLSDICRAGRASPRHDGKRWGVVIDRPSSLVVAHVNNRNARDLGRKRTTFVPPHAYRVTFLDQTNAYQSREMIVRWPGYTGDMTIIEELVLPGKTDPVEIWRETRRRQYEAIYRRAVYSATQDGAVRTATRGDLVRTTFEMINPTGAAHRVTAIRGQMIAFDGYVEMEAGQTYAVEFMQQVGSGDDASFVSTRRNVMTLEGRHDSLLFEGDGAVPALDMIFQFGRLDAIAMDTIVAGVETGEAQTSILKLLPAAPIIDTLTDAEIMPEWDGRAGGSVIADITVPTTPRIVSIQTHYDEASGDADGLSVLLEPGADNTAFIGSYQVRHRLAGASVWSSPVSSPAGAGEVLVLGYTAGQSVEMQRLAVSATGYASDWSGIFTAPLASPEDVPAPVPSAVVTAGLGFAGATFATPAGTNLAKVNIYRGPTDNIADASLVASLAVSGLSSYSHVDGDATPANLLTNPGFNADTDWTKGAGWTIDAGKATKSAGSQSAISQAIGLTPGDAYRTAFTLSGFGGSGSIRARLSGSATTNGTLRTANGRHLDRLVAVSGNTNFGLNADAAFTGSVDDVIAYKESPTSVPQGQHYYFFRSANSVGGEAAPFTVGPVTIV